MQRQYAGNYQLWLWNPAGVTNSQVAVLSYIGPVQSQINSAAPGQVISLPSGTYGETLSVGQNLTLTGAGPGATVFDGLNLGTVLHVLPGANVTVSGIGFRNGNATNDLGGGIKNEGQLTLSNCVIQNCVAGAGGGLANLQDATIEYCSLLCNQALGMGGGIFNPQQTTLQLVDSTVSSNAAPDGAGVVTGGNLFVTNCTVSWNLASGAFGTYDGNGGGIQCLDGQAWVVNSTVSMNQAAAYALSPGGGTGGGIRVDGGVLNLSYATISSNTAANGAGGVVVVSNGVVKGRNTIIGNNIAGGTAADFGGTFSSQGYNLLQTIASIVITGDTNGNILGLDPMLGPLQDNGGPTWTQALLPSSPAIDAGACDDPPTDQRGVPRPFDVPWITNVDGGCDIGAFELDAPYPVLLISGRSADSLTLSWEGRCILQTASSLLGPSADTAASSPFTVSFKGGNAGFFRLKLLIGPWPVLLISGRSSDSLTLSWEGLSILQTAPSPSGPWQDTAGLSPFAVSCKGGNASFFRLKVSVP